MTRIKFFLTANKAIGHIRILTVVLETRMKEKLMRRNHFKCKLFPPHEPLSHARSSPTVKIRIRSIVLVKKDPLFMLKRQMCVCYERVKCEEWVQPLDGMTDYLDFCCRRNLVLQDSL